MSVIMAMRITVDPARFEQVAKENEAQLVGIAEQAKQAGIVKHAFFAGDGEVMVVDEWPDEQSFLGFFESQSGEIGQLMQSAGVSNQPQPTFWRAIDTPDRI
jgi:hypothetical protein